MIKIFATSENTGERFEILDQYWFEENGVHDWHGHGHNDKFTFEFYLENTEKMP
jgi:hypothetical protein